MKRRARIAGLLCVVATLLAAGSFPVAAQTTNKLKFSEIMPLLQSTQPSASAMAKNTGSAVSAKPERPRFTQTPEGYLASISTGPDVALTATPGPAGQPEVTAKNFLKENGKLFGVTSPSVDFKLRKKNSANGRHSIRLTQTYDGIPVFGGELVVQVNDGGGIEHVSGKIDRDTDDLDQKRLSTKATLTATEAGAIARSHYAGQATGQALSNSSPELTLFVPELLKLKGPKRLTWKMDVWSADHLSVGKQVFIDAHTGEFVQEITLLMAALNRNIYDCNNNSADNVGTLVRTEGGPPAALTEANYAYDYLGDTYNFYLSHFGRDGIDGNGSPMKGHVRYCDPTKSCPLKNAFGGGAAGEMYFGDGYAAGDDVCAHELTHGVTARESALIYLNEPGAINESLSDVFGEFVDLTNGKGNDSASVRWEIGEDIPGGYIRLMSDPPDKNNPDWTGSSYYQQPSNTNDYGGVHNNSGVNNKLCYLLTDGDDFRDITVTGMGIDPVAALYYEVNVNLLTSSSGWNELAIAMQQGAVNLGWSTDQRVNLEHALLAVDIGYPGTEYYVDENASGACFHTGDSFCEFLAANGPYNSLSTAVTDHGGSKTLLLRGTAHETRLSGVARIVPWDGSARIQHP